MADSAVFAAVRPCVLGLQPQSPPQRPWSLVTTGTEGMTTEARLSRLLRQDPRPPPEARTNVGRAGPTTAPVLSSLRSLGLTPAGRPLL